MDAAPKPPRPTVSPPTCCPVITALQSAGITDLRGLAAALNARGSRTKLWLSETHTRPAYGRAKRSP
jgi:hypothetical protein